MRAEVFVPWNCSNGCTFCPTRAAYGNMELSIGNTLEAIGKLKDTGLVDSWLITGGEPLSNLEGLRRIADACGDGKLYIVTTLPAVADIDEVTEYINGNVRLRDITISRQISEPLKNVAGVEVINRIRKPVRINVVADNSTAPVELENFTEFWLRESVAFNVSIRHKYQEIDDDNVHGRDNIDKWLEGKYEKVRESSCPICSVAEYEVADGKTVRYMKRIHNRNDVHSNVIVSPDGRLCGSYFEEDSGLNSLVAGEEDMEPMVLVDRFGCYMQAESSFLFRSDRKNARVVRNSYEAAVLKRMCCDAELRSA